MKAFILAAGFGTRLKPFTEKFPKPLVPVNGVPLVLHTLAFLKTHGIREVVMNLHHRGEVIPKLLGNGSALGMKITYSREKVILGTGGGIKKALKLLSDDFLVMNGDILTDFDLPALIAQHKKSQNVATLALYSHPEAAKYGLLSYEGKKLTSFLGTPKPSAKSRHAMFSGIHVLSKLRLKKRLRAFPPQKPFCIIRDIYIPEILAGQNFGAFLLGGKWVVCDRLSDVAAVEKSKLRLSYQKEVVKMLAKLKDKKILQDLESERIKNYKI